ncbi:MAG: MotA/TolQ/ExbB proton channel family protein [Bacteroidia bacterium]
MSISFLGFAIGALDAFGYYKIEVLQGPLNIPSLLVILGGTLFQVFAAFPVNHVYRALAELKPTLSLVGRRAHEEAMIDHVMNLVRGLKNNRHDTIARLMDGKSKGFRLYLAELLSTNYSLEEIRILGHHKINTLRQSEAGPLRVVNALAAASPAYGMLGTLMGLIVMLSNFENARGLASGLALALMTTFYGLLMTQFIWQPLSKKLLHGMLENQLRREIELEGVLLTLENKAELYIIDQLSAMVQARDGASTINA